MPLHLNGPTQLLILFLREAKHAVRSQKVSIVNATPDLSDGFDGIYSAFT